MSAPLVNRLGLELRGVQPSIRNAGLILLGQELQHEKAALGYCGMGLWQVYREETKSGTRPTWTQFCLREAGISEISATNYFMCGEAIKQRLAWNSRTKGSKSLLRLLERRPSQLTAECRGKLVRRIAAVIGSTPQRRLILAFRSGRSAPEDARREGESEAGARRRAAVQRQGRVLQAMYADTARREKPGSARAEEALSQSRKLQAIMLALKLTGAVAMGKPDGP